MSEFQAYKFGIGAPYRCLHHAAHEHDYQKFGQSASIEGAEKMWTPGWNGGEEAENVSMHVESSESESEFEEPSQTFDLRPGSMSHWNPLL